MNDLWPDFKTDPQELSPIAILKSQGTILGQKTGNLVIAKIEQGVAVYGDVPGTATNVEFSVFAPALGHYEVTLFRMFYSFQGLYPVYIRDIRLVLEGKEKEVRFDCANERELMETLRLIFTNPKTLNIINSMIGHSRGLS